MATRFKTKKKAVVTQNSEFSSKIKCLEADLKYSLRAIDGKSEVLDKLFTNQANRIGFQIKIIKEKQ
jgi:hypothetical protein